MRSEKEIRDALKGSVAADVESATKALEWVLNEPEPEFKFKDGERVNVKHARFPTWTGEATILKTPISFGSSLYSVEMKTGIETGKQGLIEEKYISAYTYTEPEPQFKFEVGQRVYNSYGKENECEDIWNATGVITSRSFYNGASYSVIGDINGKTGSFDEKYLSERPDPKFKIGDKVIAPLGRAATIAAPSWYADGVAVEGHWDYVTDKGTFCENTLTLAPERKLPHGIVRWPNGVVAVWYPEILAWGLTGLGLSEDGLTRAWGPDELVRAFGDDWEVVEDE